MPELRELLLIVGIGCMIVLGLTRLVGSILHSQRYLLIGGLVGALLVPTALGVCVAIFGPAGTEQLLFRILLVAAFPTFMLIAWAANTLHGAPFLWGGPFSAWVFGGFAVLNWILLGLAVGAVLRLLHVRPGAARRP